MKNIRIISTGRALPDSVVTNDDLSKIMDTSDEWINSRTGIKQRYKCNQESCVSMAKRAAENAIKKAGVELTDIGAIIVATSTPNTIFPSVACTLQKEMGFSKDIMAFDIAAACTGFLYGIKIAHGLLNTMDKKYALVIGSEELSRILDYTDRSTSILFGDGAGAAIVALDDTVYYQKLWSDGNKEVLYCNGPGIDDNYLHMKGNDVFKFAVTVIDKAMKEILETANMTMEDIDYVVCHQANARIIEFVKKKYKAYSDKFYMNIENYGNTSSASIPIVIDELLEKENVKNGKETVKLLCVAFGAGLTWSSAIIEC